VIYKLDLIKDTLIKGKNLRFPKYESKQKYLFDIYQMFNDLCIAYNYIDDDGDMGWSKWFRYDKLMELEPWMYVPKGFGLKRDELIEKCTHRSVASWEIVFDVDDTKLSGVEGVFGSIIGKADYIHKELRGLGYDVMVSFTQNKSIHLHIIEEELMRLSNRERTRYKQNLLEKYGCDVQKGVDRCMISMLGSKHYKSGKKKILLHWR